MSAVKGGVAGLPDFSASPPFCEDSEIRKLLLQENENEADEAPAALSSPKSTRELE